MLAQNGVLVLPAQWTSAPFHHGVSNAYPLSLIYPAESLRPTRRQTNAERKFMYISLRMKYSQRLTSRQNLQNRERFLRKEQVCEVGASCYPNQFTYLPPFADVSVTEEIFLHPGRLERSQLAGDRVSRWHDVEWFTAGRDDRGRTFPGQIESRSGAPPWKDAWRVESTLRDCRGLLKADEVV